MIARLASAPAAEDPAVDPAIRSKQRKISNLMSRLDDDAKTQGYINKDTMLQILDLIEETGQVSDFQAQLLLGCTGQALVTSSTEERIRVTQEMWDRLLALGLEPKTVHYNALMKSHLDNEFPFKPEDILAEMESKSLSPNKITLQRMISHYCEQGDLERARSVLENMKQSGYPVSDVTFNDFIRGHLRAGDKENAKGMFEIMKTAGLNPNHLTVRAYLCGLAEKGDIDAIVQFLEEENETFNVTTNSLLPVAITLIKNGYSKDISRIDFNRRKHPGYVTEVATAILQIVAMGNMEDAMFLLRLVKPENAGTNSLGRQLITSMIHAGRTTSEVVEVSRQLAGEGYIERELDAVHAAYLSHKPDFTLELIKEYEKMEHVIKAHFFLPCITQFAEQKNLEGVMKTLEHMKSLKVTNLSNEVRRSITHEFLIPALQSLDVPRLDIVNRIDGSDFFHSGGVNEVLLTHALQDGDLDEVNRIMEESRWVDLRKDLDRVPFFLYRLYTRKSPELTMFFNIMANLVKKGGDRGGIQCCSMVLRRILCSFKSLQDAPLEQILKLSKEKGIRLLPKDGNTAVQYLSNLNASEDLLKSFEELKISENQQDRTQSELYEKMSVEELEEIAEKAGKLRSKSMEKELLMKYCFTMKADKANALKAELQEKGFVFRGDMIRQLGVLARKTEDLQGALQYLDQLITNYPDYSAYGSFFLAVCRDLIKAGRHAEALSRIKDFGKSCPQVVMKTKSQTNNADVLSQLMYSTVQHTDFSTSVQVMEELYNAGYVDDSSLVLPQELIRAMLDIEKDPGDIIAAVEFIYKRFNDIVWVGNLFSHFIALDDAEHLQKVLDMCIVTRGKLNALFILAENFMRCGKKAQAKKTIENIQGMKYDFSRLFKAKIDNWVSKKKFDLAENVVELGLEVCTNAEKDQLLFLLIKMYCNDLQFEKALSVLTQYEELGLVPSPQALNFLARHLKKNLLEVPFEVPEMTWGRKKRWGQKRDSKTSSESNVNQSEAADQTEAAHSSSGAEKDTQTVA